MIKLSMLKEPTVNKLAEFFATRPIPVTFSEADFMSLPKIIQIMIVGDITDPELLTQFSYPKFPRHVRLRCAASQHCPKETLHKFLNENDIQFILNVAENQETSVDDIMNLSKHADHRVRAKVAYNPATPDTILRLLATDKDLRVRQAVTNNRHVPEDVLIFMARDRSALVRQGIASQIELPYKVSQILLQDNNTSVLFALARNKTMEKSEDVLMALAQTGSHWCKKPLRTTPKPPKKSLVISRLMEMMRLRLAFLRFVTHKRINLIIKCHGGSSTMVFFILVIFEKKW